MLAALLGAACAIAYVWQPRPSGFDSVYLEQVESHYAETNAVRLHYRRTDAQISPKWVVRPFVTFGLMIPSSHSRARGAVWPTLRR